MLLVKDKWSSVRAAAVRMLTHCIQLVKNVCIRYVAVATLLGVSHGGGGGGGGGGGV